MIETIREKVKEGVVFTIHKHLCYMHKTLAIVYDERNVLLICDDDALLDEILMYSFLIQEGKLRSLNLWGNLTFLTSNLLSVQEQTSVVMERFNLEINKGETHE